MQGRDFYQFALLPGMFSKHAGPEWTDVIGERLFFFIGMRTLHGLEAHRHHDREPPLLSPEEFVVLHVTLVLSR
jgi:hypothetical protein